MLTVLANLCGSLSLACWIILLLPQLIEQWRLKSADGIAIGFILAWFFGDLANLVGSVLGHLRSSVVLLALWFCFSDSLLILSYFYYKRLQTVGSSMETPLLQERVNANTSTTASINSQVEERRNFMLSTVLPAVFVGVVVTLSYFISSSNGEEEIPSKNTISQLLGYISALFYLIARIPQIIQNHKRRSVTGLSMGFFVLSIVGNLTYAAQVLLLRTDKQWLLAYLPWLLGSLGTIAEDLVVLMQFHMY